jgi:hypothetical protein
MHNFHVHVGAKSAAGEDYNKVADWVRRLLLLTAHHEMALYGASGTRRRYNGRYCASLRQGRWAQKKESLKKRDMTADELRLSSSGIDRYQLLNVQNLFGTKQTVEFRVFSGTMESLKMIAWVQMCLALATRALDHTAEFEGVNARYASNGARGAMKRFFYLMQCGTPHYISYADFRFMRSTGGDGGCGGVFRPRTQEVVRIITARPGSAAAHRWDGNGAVARRFPAAHSMPFPSSPNPRSCTYEWS